jgi:hypothetical protein
VKFILSGQKKTEKKISKKVKKFHQSIDFAISAVFFMRPRVGEHENFGNMGDGGLRINCWLTRPTLFVIITLLDCGS